MLHLDTGINHSHKGRHDMTGLESDGKKRDMTDLEKAVDAIVQAAEDEGEIELIYFRALVEKILEEYI